MGLWLFAAEVCACICSVSTGLWFLGITTFTSFRIIFQTVKEKNLCNHKYSRKAEKFRSCLSLEEFRQPVWEERCSVGREDSGLFSCLQYMDLLSEKFLVAAENFIQPWLTQENMETTVCIRQGHRRLLHLLFVYSWMFTHFWFCWLEEEESQFK